MSSPESNHPTRPEALRTLAQLQIERLKKEEDEDQWISGEELYTEGSSDEDDTAVRNKRRKHRRGTPSKEGRHKQPQHKKPSQPSTSSDSGGKASGISPPELKFESLSLAGEESHKEASMHVSDKEEQIEISWRPKRGSIKLPNLNAEVCNPEVTVSFGEEENHLTDSEDKTETKRSEKKKKKAHFLDKNIKLAADGMGILSVTDDEKEQLRDLLANLDEEKDPVNPYRIDPTCLADIDSRLEVFNSKRKTVEDLDLCDEKKTISRHEERKLQQRLQDIDNILTSMTTANNKKVQPIAEDQIHRMIKDFGDATATLNKDTLDQLLEEANRLMPHFQYRYNTDKSSSL